MKLEEDQIKCVCGKWAKPDRLKVEGSIVRGWKCDCGEEYFHPEDIGPILTLNKLKMEALKGKVARNGNSISIRIPKELANALKLKIGKDVSIVLENSREFVVRV